MNPLRKLHDLIGEALKPGGGRFELAAGETRQIEVARPGTFHAKRGGKVSFTPTSLAAIAKTFDPDTEHKIKIGHKDIDTDTPDYGDVVGLKYDDGKQRLFAAIKPTESLVEKNRKGEFHRVSMELDQVGDGKFEFDTVSFLGAHGAAIPDLARVALAGGKIIICAAGDPAEDDEDATDEGKPKQPAASAAVKQEEPGMSEPEKAQLAKAEEENKGLKVRLAAFTADRAKNFLLGDPAKKKLSMAELKPGGNTERFLARLAELDATSNDSIKVKLAAGDGKSEVETPLFDAATQILLARPDKLTSNEQRETVLEGVEEDGETHLAGAEKYDFAGRFKNVVQFAESKFHQKVLAKLAELKKGGNEKATYEEASELIGEAEGRGN